MAYLPGIPKCTLHFFCFFCCCCPENHDRFVFVVTRKITNYGYHLQKNYAKNSEKLLKVPGSATSPAADQLRIFFFFFREVSTVTGV